MVTPLGIESRRTCGTLCCGHWNWQKFMTSGEATGFLVPLVTRYTAGLWSPSARTALSGLPVSAGPEVMVLKSDAGTTVTWKAGPNNAQAVFGREWSKHSRQFHLDCGRTAPPNKRDEGASFGLQKSSIEARLRLCGSCRQWRETGCGKAAGRDHDGFVVLAVDGDHVLKMRSCAHIVFPFK